VSHRWRRVSGSAPAYTRSSQESLPRLRIDPCPITSDCRRPWGTHGHLIGKAVDGTVLVGRKAQLDGMFLERTTGLEPATPTLAKKVRAEGSVTCGYGPTWRPSRRFRSGATPSFCVTSRSLTGPRRDPWCSRDSDLRPDRGIDPLPPRSVRNGPLYKKDSSGGFSLGTPRSLWWEHRAPPAFRWAFVKPSSMRGRLSRCRAMIMSGPQVRSPVDGALEADVTPRPGRAALLRQRRFRCTSRSARTLIPFSIRLSIAKSPNSIRTRLNSARPGVFHR
jgi:hypothetical protein